MFTVKRYGPNFSYFLDSSFSVCNFRLLDVNFDFLQIFSLCDCLLFPLFFGILMVSD